MNIDTFIAEFDHKISELWNLTDNLECNTDEIEEFKTEIENSVNDFEDRVYEIVNSTDFEDEKKS